MSAIEQFFYEHPVFRYDEFANWKMSNREINKFSISNALQYYASKGRIIPIRRKLYAVVPPGQSANTLHIDPYLIAGKATDDAVLCYHTTLELMGLAYSVFNQFTYMTKQKSKPFEFQEQWFQPVSIPSALHEKQCEMWGITTINRQGVSLQITNTERTFVDILDRIVLSGGFEEVCRSLNNFTVLNIGKVVEYSLLFENACLNAKVGYFLSLRKGAFAVSVNQLAPLLAAKPKIPQYTVKRDGKSFQLIKQWNILLPVSVINQSWEEPHVDN